MKKFFLLTLFAVLLTPWTVKAEILTFDFEDGQVPSAWANDKTYPWVVVSASQGSGHTGTYCLKSGNTGVSSSSSAIEATFTFVGDGSISFLGGCWGEGTSTAWDKCIFYIDGVQQFAYGERDTWETYTFEVEAGDHTFKWEYTKDGSVSKTGDAFFIDDVVVDLGTAAACPKPLSITASAIGSHDATLTWADGGGTYNVEYKKASDTIWTAVLSNSPLLSTTISNLDPLTDYQMRVQSACGTEVSGWKLGSFTTAVGIPFVGDFSNGSIPAIWSRFDGLLENVLKGTAALTPTTSGWSSSAVNGVFGTDKHLKINIYGASCKYWIVTPSIMMENNVQLSFDLALTKYSGTLDPVDKTQQADDKFAVLITTDGGSTWQVLRQWDNAGSEYVYNDINCSVNGEAVAIDLSSYSGTSIAIALYGESTVNNNGDNNLHIGNFKIGYVPTCFKPIDLTAANITTTSASIGWTASGSETNWMIQYKKVGATAWNTVGAGSNPFTLQNLDPASRYDVQVAAWCDPTDSAAISDFSRAITVVTECNPVASFPWTENFDSIEGSTTASANNLPVCWNYINTTSYSSYKGYPIVYNYSSSSHSPTNCLKLCSYFSTYSDYDPQPQYAILPEMTGIDDKQLTIWAKGYNAGNTVKVGRMSDPSDASTFQIIAEQALTLSYKEYTFSLSGVNGNYIAFMIDAATAENTYNGAFIDDISVHEAPACTKPSALAVSEVKSHTAKLRWIPGSDEDAWQIMLNGDAEHLIAADSNVFVLTNLPADSMFVAKVRANCGAAQSEWANDSVIFTTLVACPAPEFDTDSVKNIMAHTADLSWGGDAESYIVSYRIPAHLSGFSEDFEDTFDGWTLRNCAGGTGVSTGDHHSGSKAFRFSYNSNPPQYLISPMLSLAAGDSLKFWYKNYSANYPETFQVGYSSTDDANDSFVFGEELTASDIQWHQFVELVPAGTKYICWKYNSNDMFYFFIDDVEIGEVIPAGEWTVQSGITANGIQLTGLAAETKYEVTVQANCGGEDGTSLTIPSATFKTISDCQTPSALDADSLTASSAVISWETYGLENFNLRYGTEGENWTVVTGISMPYTLTGLSSGTEYQVQVQAACNTEAWSTTFSFKTVYAIPFAPVVIEADEWYAKSGLAADIFAGGNFLNNASTWTICDANEAFDADHLKINNYGTARKDWAISPVIDATGVQLVEGQQLQLSFTVAMAKYSSSGSMAQVPDTTGIDDKFIVAFSIDNGATWSAANATEWNNGDSAVNVYNSIPNTGMEVNLDFSAAAGHVMRLAFYAESTISNADNDIHVGDIVLDVIGSGTDIRAIEANDKAFKFIENGQIYISLDGVTYDVVGRKVK